jgi:ferredoxin
VQKALFYITEFLGGPMCGKCLPCPLGSFEAKLRLENIAAGKGNEADLRALNRIAADMAEASMCKKGKDTAKFILEWIDTGVFGEHIAGRCRDEQCLSLIEYRIIADECTICGDCKEVCKFNAIIGEKQKPWRSGYLPFEIRQMRCTKCGECIKVCHTGAIRRISVGDYKESRQLSTVSP